MNFYHQCINDLVRVYPEGEARALVFRMLEDGFGLTQMDVLLGKDNELSADNLTKAKDFVTRMIQHEPIQYIVGATEFCGHRFFVGPGALIPRPETQDLVSFVLESCRSRGAHPRILDIGTGTGCIALSLSMGFPEADVTGWDISPEALAVAHRNADLYPNANVCFEQADILVPPEGDRYWNVIVSNPPYVCQGEAASMSPNVLEYEPHMALFVPDDDPLIFYRAIGRYAQAHLLLDGLLAMEINQRYGAETCHMIEELGFCDARVIQDRYGCDRFVVAMKK